MNRPIPPDTSAKFSEASEVYLWAHETLFNQNHDWHNADHNHLVDYQVNEIAFLWANIPFEKAGKRILGQTEKVMIDAGGWRKARQEMWFEDMLGAKPDFLITLDAEFCRECSDMQFLALIDHELYHIGHATDNFGELAFNRDTGRPKLRLVSHDVEEFHGITRRYGANIFDDSLQTMIDLSQLGGELNG